MRWIIAVLAVAVFAMQTQLLLSADGYRKTSDLRIAALEQRRQNDQLRQRNIALEAEVVNLKHRSEAAEERARSDLGMIGKNETFYQVVPVASNDD